LDERDERPTQNIASTQAMLARGFLGTTVVVKVTEPPYTAMIPSLEIYIGLN
jgi:3-methyladenine DNA glycosylase Mpg